MTNPQNKKVKMTKLLLKKSLFEYLAEKQITELNVKMICNKAQINRSTFYLHYKSIDDMLNSIKDKEKYDIFTLNELLPLGFGPSNLL